jgi:hypothetical protein
LIDSRHIHRHIDERAAAIVAINLRQVVVDLDCAPGETNNIASQNPEIVKELTDLLE